MIKIVLNKYCRYCVTWRYTKMSQEKAKNPRCVSCSGLLRKSVRRTTDIKTQLQAEEMAKHLGVTISVGDLLCNKCRVKGLKCKSKETMSQELLDPDSSLSKESSDEDETFKVKESISEHQTEENVEIPFPRVISTHKYCFLCGSTKKLITVPFDARQQVFAQKRVFIPKNNRCCMSHLIKKRLYSDELTLLKIQSPSSEIEVRDFKKLLTDLTERTEVDIIDKVGDFTLSEEKIHTLTGLNWRHIEELSSMLTSMKNSPTRNIMQALVVFLFKLRTGNSNKVTAALLGLQCQQQVSEYVNSVIQSFEKDVLPNHFGFHALSRDELIRNETSEIAKRLFNSEDRLILVFDGTYVHHEKSSNNEYQRRSYSGQKKKPLCKPFTIVTTNGYIIETLGPFSANLNDASIMDLVLNDPNGLRSILKAGDICVVDRGFRDVKEKLSNMGKFSEDNLIYNKAVKQL